MKKMHLLLMSLLILLLVMIGCQKSVPKETEIKFNMDNIERIDILYGYNNYGASIKDETEIKQLVNQLNGAVFNKTDEKIKLPRVLYITFIGKDSTIKITVDDNDVVQFQDGICVISKQIEFEPLLKIFNDYNLNKK